MKKAATLFVCLALVLPLAAQSNESKAPTATEVTKYVLSHGIRDGRLGKWKISFNVANDNNGPPNTSSYAILAARQTGKKSGLVASYAMVVSTERFVKSTKMTILIND